MPSPDRAISDWKQRLYGGFAFSISLTHLARACAIQNERDETCDSLTIGEEWDVPEAAGRTTSR
jgi:hypothetical protein